MSFSIAEEEVATIGADIPQGPHGFLELLRDHPDTDKNKSFVDAYKTMFGQDRVTSDPAEAALRCCLSVAMTCEKAGSFEVDDALDAIHTGEISFDAPEALSPSTVRTSTLQSRFASVRFPMMA